jgi:hypothetical protein
VSSARVTAWPQPSPRALLAACTLPLVALAVWFGLIDSPPIGEGRCESCGVEAYVIAAHVAVGVWLGAVVACASAVQRRSREGIAAPGGVTARALAAAALFVIASLAWHGLFTVPAVVAIFASLAVLPAVAIWWVLAAIGWRRPAGDGAGPRRRPDLTLAMAWVSLALLLPAVYAWVWMDRVEWIVF